MESCTDGNFGLVMYFFGREITSLILVPSLLHSWMSVHSHTTATYGS